MRTLYVDVRDAAESNARARVLNVATAWWEAVQVAMAPWGPPAGGGFPSQLDLPGLNLESGRLCASLHAAVDLAEVPANTLGVIAVRGEKVELQPLAELVVSLAPKLAGILVEAYRPALKTNIAFERALSATGVELRGARFRVGVGRGHLLEVVAHVPKQNGDVSEDEVVVDALEGLLEDLLGQEIFERWVGEIRWEPLKTKVGLRVVGEGASNPELHSAAELPALVAGAERDILAGLPQILFSERDTCGWTLLEVEARGEATSGQAPLDRQPDLAIVATAYPELMRCFLSGASFASQRFSARGERFVYIEAQVHGTAEQRFHSKELAEKAFDHCLRGSHLGAVIGAGMGTHFIYITVALNSIEAALPLLRAESERLPALKGCILRFMDSEWANEWIAL